MSRSSAQGRAFGRWYVFAGIAALAMLGSAAELRHAVGRVELDLTGYKLTFDENFDQLSASPDGIGTTWETKYYWGGRQLSGASDYYLDESVGGLGQSPYSVAQGVLTIQARPTSPELKAAGVPAPFTTGQIDTRNSFSQTYGYFEMRAQASGTYGTNSAFWLLPHAGAWPPEIDIAEVLGRDPKTDVITNHSSSSKSAHRATATTGLDLSKGFHTYGVMWTPTTLTFFLDGVARYTTPTQADEHQPMYILATLGVGGSWAANPPATNFSAEMKIDYIRAYSNDPNATAVDPRSRHPSEHGAAARQTQPGNSGNQARSHTEGTYGNDLGPTSGR